MILIKGTAIVEFSMEVQDNDNNTEVLKLAYDNIKGVCNKDVGEHGAMSVNPNSVQVHVTRPGAQQVIINSIDVLQ